MWKYRSSQRPCVNLARTFSKRSGIWVRTGKGYVPNRVVFPVHKKAYYGANVFAILGTKIVNPPPRVTSSSDWGKGLDRFTRRWFETRPRLETQGVVDSALSFFRRTEQQTKVVFFVFIFLCVYCLPLALLARVGMKCCRVGDSKGKYNCFCLKIILEICVCVCV